VRVPGFVSGGVVPLSASGRKYDGLMHISDVMATVLPHAGIRAEEIDGVNQWDVRKMCLLDQSM
jgi:arylsulfatase A-like enzyme